MFLTYLREYVESDNKVDVDPSPNRKSFLVKRTDDAAVITCVKQKKKLPGRYRHRTFYAKKTEGGLFHIILLSTLGMNGQEEFVFLGSARGPC